MPYIAKAIADIDDKIRLVWFLIDLYREDKDWVFNNRKRNMDHIDNLLEYRFKLMRP